MERGEREMKNHEHWRPSLSFRAFAYAVIILAFAVGWWGG